MLIVQKFLSDLGCKEVFPVPDDKGFIAYSYKQGKTTHYEFIYYKWENTKSHPSYYCFRYLKKYDMKNWDANLQYKNWNSFFGEIYQIKDKLHDKDNIIIASNYEEATQMLWKTFVRVEDAYLANFASSLPESFIKSIDENCPIDEQIESREDFLRYLKSKLVYLYMDWNNFIDIDIKTNFCNWFYNYYHGII